MYFLVFSMISKEKIKHIKKLHSKKWRIDLWLFLVEGRKMILELLASDWKEQIEELYVSEKLFDEIIAISSSLDKGRIVMGGEGILSKISTLESNSDWVAIVKQKENIYKSWEVKKWILVLDGIRDPWNMGTILRTAAWFWMRDIICSEDSVEIYNPKVVSATMWALFHLNISFENLEVFYNSNTLPVYAWSLNWISMRETSLPESWVLVMGSESHGISEISQKYMTQGVLIPKLGYWESLNVWIATWIFLSHISQS